MKTFFASVCLMLLAGTTVNGQSTSQAIPPPQNTASKPKAVEPEYPLDLAKTGLTLPFTSDPELRRILKSPKTIFYKLPPIWQHYIPGSKIEHNNLTLGTKSYTTTRPTWAVYFAPFLGDFNANPLFPWETTIGLNSTHKEGVTIYKTVNLLNLPEDAQGEVLPILVLSDYPIKWIYPDGTTLGEIIYVVEDGQRYIQEIRTRTKSKGAKDWQPNVYRPVKDRAEFMALTGIKDYVVPYRYMFFRNPQEEEVFKMEGLVERLPPLDKEKVKELLSRPFKNVTDALWSPASDQDFHIMPRNYCFSLLKSVDSFTCADCHRQTQISVLNLTPKEPLIIDNPAKVGNIRGSDTGFTWYPISTKSVRHSDQEPELKLSLRDYDTQNKIVRVVQYGEKFYGTENYKLTAFVQDSLKSYELPAAQFLHDKTK